MRVHPITGEKLAGRTNSTFTDHYAKPENYRHVLDEFPGLRLCLAHYGGADGWLDWLVTPWRPEENKEPAWLSVISDLIRDYDNVFADISYTAYEPRLLPLIKVLVNTPELRNHILYGSDFYMLQQDVTEREFSVDLRGYLGEEDFRPIAVENPRAFLGQ